MTIKSQDDLTSILNAPLAKWRVFLHPSQDKLVGKKFNGPARVLGGPGTGKTVVAMHRARHLAGQVFTEKTDRILFTTYTANLAENVEQNLRSLCGDEMDRIEVVHLHAWAVRFMKTRAWIFEVRLRRGDRPVLGGGASVVGDPDFDVGFLQQEWAQVVQANGITTMPEYLQGAPHRPGPDTDQAPAGQGLEGLRGVPLGPQGQGQARMVAGDPGDPPLSGEEEGDPCPTGPSWWTRARTSTPRSGS